MYSLLPSFVLGFHGCDERVAESIWRGRAKHLRTSQNDYDWLGHGSYFWENSPARALEFARERTKRIYRNTSLRIRKPAVIGAVIDLGYCLNLMDSKFFPQIQQAYDFLKSQCAALGVDLPVNRPLRGSSDPLLRDLDCSVINMIHKLRERLAEPGFETVRSAFVEGEPLYAGASFRNKNHIQICVRNIDCIKGYFRPMTSSR